MVEIAVENRTLSDWKKVLFLIEQLFLKGSHSKRFIFLGQTGLENKDFTLIGQAVHRVAVLQSKLIQIMVSIFEA